MKDFPWNKERAQKYLPLLQALAEGKTIQFNEASTRNPRWVDIPDPDFTALPEDYRIKPNPPSVLYVNEYTDGFPVGYPCLAEAVHRAERLKFTGRVGVKYVEAVD